MIMNITISDKSVTEIWKPILSYTLVNEYLTIKFKYLV